GAPFGGTTRGAHQGFDSEAFSLITPPNAAGGGGICFPVMVVVAPGEPNSPVTTCPPAGPESAVRPRRRTIRLLVCRTSRRKHMRNAPVLQSPREPDLSACLIEIRHLPIDCEPGPPSSPLRSSP